MLISGSMHDDRVPFWMPLKWIAKVRQHNKTEVQETDESGPNTSSKFLCMMDEDGGHFGSGGIQGGFEQVNCVLFFLLFLFLMSFHIHFSSF